MKIGITTAMHSSNIIAACHIMINHLSRLGSRVIIRVHFRGYHGLW